MTIDIQGEVNRMSENTSGRIENFIESLKLPKDVATVLFESDEDCHSFFEDFYMRNKYVIDDLLDFREYKISKSKITLDLFVEKCYTNNVRKVFESTFYQSFTDEDMDKLSEAIVSGKVSLEKLFTDFQKNPNKNILRNVL